MTHQQKFITPIPVSHPAYSLKCAGRSYQFNMTKSGFSEDGNTSILEVDMTCYSFSDMKQVPALIFSKEIFKFHYQFKHNIKAIIVDSFDKAKRLANIYGQKMISVQHGDNRFFAVLKAQI